MCNCIAQLAWLLARKLHHKPQLSCIGSEIIRAVIRVFEQRLQVFGIRVSRCNIHFAAVIQVTKSEDMLASFIESESELLKAIDALRGT